MARGSTTTPGGSVAGRPQARQSAPLWRQGPTWVCILLLCAIVVCAHFNGLHGEFNFDDEFNFVDNPHYRGLSWPQLAWMFTTFHMGHYQPLSWVTLAVDYLIWGMNPFGYHLTNLILHVANAALVYLLALAILGLRRMEKPAAAERGWPVHGAALVAALLFAVHPLRVESVAWATERRDVLSSFFLLITVLLYLHAQSAAGQEQRRRWLRLALAVYLLSLLSRAMGVTLPLVLVLLDWYPLGRLGHHAGGPLTTRRFVPGGWLGPQARRVYLEKLPLLVPAVIFAVVAPLAQQAAQAAISVTEYSLPRRLGQACYGLVFYLWKTVLPVGLSPLYEIPARLPAFYPKYVAAAAVVVAAAALIWVCRRRCPWLIVVALTHVILLAPVLGLFQAGRQEVADRYSYLPAVGWAILVAGGLLRLWRQPRHRRLAIAAWSAAVVCIGMLTWLAACQSLVWRTPESLWLHATRHAPSETTHQNLGAIYARTGRLPEAIEHYRIALQYEPLDERALYGLAWAYTHLRRFDEAAQVWQTLVRHVPRDAQAHLQLAHARRELGLPDEALRGYATAAQLDPNLVEAHMNIGTLWLERGAPEKAIAAFRQALAVRSDLPDAHYYVANALSRQGRLEEAVGEYALALQARADFPDARNNLGLTLEQLGKLPQALEEYRSVVASHPEHVTSRYNLARVLALLGRREEAIAQFREVLNRQPDHADARQKLDVLLGRRSSGG